MKHFTPILLLAKLLSLAFLSTGCNLVDSPARAEPSAAAVEAYHAELAALQASVDRIESAVQPPILDLSPLAAVDVEHGALLLAIDANLDALIDDSLKAEPAAVEQATATVESAPAALLQESPIPPARLVTLNGQQVDVDAFLAKWYRGMRTSVEGKTMAEHLVDHGVTAGVAQLSEAEREKLHSAIHEQEKAERKSRAVVRSKAVLTAPPAASNCPNGQCQLPQQYRVKSRRRNR